MTTITAKASGNWSAGSTWNSDPNLPASGDTVECAGYTVTIDQDVTVAQIQSSSSGYFVVSAAHTISARIVSAAGHSGGGVLRITHTSGTVAITGDVSGVGVGNSGIVHITGANGTTTLKGNVTGGTAAWNAYGVLFNANGATLTIDGSATGGSSGAAVYISGTGAAAITGDATGGSGDGASGLYAIASSGVIEVQGWCIGGSHAKAPGVGNTGSSAVKVYKGEWNVGPAWQGYVKIVPSVTVNAIVIPRSDTGADLTMSWDYPAEAKVEAGTVYALTTKTGTLEVATCDYPAESDVRAGTEYGGRTGSLDLPATGDVQNGVKFDGNTKTGTFVAPDPSDVALDVGYGAGGTEFTGELTGGAPDWTADEKAQIRQALGITGTKAATSGGNLDAIKAVTDDLATDSEIAGAVWDEARSGHTTDGTYGDVAEWAAASNVYTDGSGYVKISGAKNTLDALQVPLTAQQTRDAMARALTPETPIPEGSIDFSRVSADMTLAAIEDVTDKLDTLLEADGPIYRLTENALKEGPGGGANVTVNASVALTATQADAVMSGQLALVAHHTFDQTIDSDTQRDLTGGELLFGLKLSDRDKDTAALVLLSSVRGLLTVDGANYSTPAHGSITVTGSAGAWHVALHLDAAVIGLLAQYAGGQLRAEVKYLETDATPLWSGLATLERGIVQTL